MKDRVLTTARRLLVETRNTDGGWGYALGRKSRLEPTCWALFALGRPDLDTADRDVLRRWPHTGGLPIDVPGAPANYTFAALAGLTLMAHPSSAAAARPIVTRMLDARGRKMPPSTVVEQDHDLQGWSWVDGTASWVEPTACALLLLKRARQLSLIASGAERTAADERIATGERLLADRACSSGGWNYGNRRVFGQDLWPYVPTTALALLALRDRREESVVQRGLDQLQHDVRSERSILAAGLALIALRTYGLAHDGLEQMVLRLFDETPQDEHAQNLFAAAVLCCAVDDAPGSHPLSL